MESLARWFDEETKDLESPGSRPSDIDLGMVPALPGSPQMPMSSRDPADAYVQVKKYVAHCGFVELFTLATLSRLPPESLQVLAQVLVARSRPRAWSSGVAPPQSAMSPNIGTGNRSSGDTSPGATSPEAPSFGVGGEGGQWHEIADPVFALELLTNMTCMRLSASQSVSQIWPLVSTHFERLLQFVISGEGSGELQFVERLIVNALRLCISLIGNNELVATLLSLLQHLSKLPPSFFAPYSERIACGLLVFVKQTSLSSTGASVIFSLVKRICELQDCVGAGLAGMEILHYWMNDDQELSRLLSQQHFPELLATLKAFAMQNSTPASAMALDHISSLVPQLARGTRNLPQTTGGSWQALWVPTLSTLSHVALEGSQKSSAQAFVSLQRLLLERGTELSLPWEQLPFSGWKECLEQVLFPLLQAQTRTASGDVPCAELVAARQANAAQLLCRVVLTHLPDWQTSSPDGFPALFLRLLHVLVSEATSASSLAGEPLLQSLKNLLLVISMDPTFSQMSSPQHGTRLLDASWSVVSPLLPDLRREIALILDPSLAEEVIAAPPEPAPVPPVPMPPHVSASTAVPPEPVPLPPVPMPSTHASASMAAPPEPVPVPLVPMPTHASVSMAAPPEPLPVPLAPMPSTHASASMAAPLEPVHVPVPSHASASMAAPQEPVQVPPVPMPAHASAPSAQPVLLPPFAMPPIPVPVSSPPSAA